MSHGAPQYSMAVASTQRNINPIRLGNDLRQAQEESFRHEQCNRGGRCQLRMRLKCTTTYNERDGNIRGQLRDIKQRTEDIDHRQSKEESYRHEQYDRVGDQRADAGSYDQVFEMALGCNGL